MAADVNPLPPGGLCFDKPAIPTGTPGSKQSEVAVPSTATLTAAVGAVRAWGCYVELLGSQFLQKDPPVGQPMLKVKPCVKVGTCHPALVYVMLLPKCAQSCNTLILKS